jgi:hypothetical protein
MEKNTIGKAIGIVSKTLKISQYKGGPSAQVTVKIDFSTATDENVRQWLASDRVIAGQRAWRSLSIEEIKALDGQTFAAQNIGRKVKSREERIQELEAAGLPRKLAEFSIDNPTAFQNAVEGIETTTVENKNN